MIDGNKMSGFSARVKAIAPECIIGHSVIYRQALDCPTQSTTVLDKVVKTVNSRTYKSEPLNSRMFSVLYDDMGSS
jgi:hypothetical protein